jgi:hypothetical protein
MKNTSLETITLKINPIKKDSLKILLKSVSFNTSLENLFISEFPTELNKEMIQVICDFLKENSKLKRINLPSCVESNLEILEALKSNQHILSFMGNETNIEFQTFFHRNSLRILNIPNLQSIKFKDVHFFWS